MGSQFAPCLRHIGSSISSVVVDSLLYELGVRSRDKVFLLNCFVGQVDDDEPCGYRNNLCEETFYDLRLSQSSSHSKVRPTNSQISTANASHNQQVECSSIPMPKYLRILRREWRGDKKPLV